mmetsp:Transcript_15348/g.25944  ORF Transcript_15348/g.25944 Transcript_15348/m.25944 type:complete len:105 (-) Transcript_15348:470-784(-)
MEVGYGDLFEAATKVQKVEQASPLAGPPATCGSEAISKEASEQVGKLEAQRSQLAQSIKDLKAKKDVEAAEKEAAQRKMEEGLKAEKERAQKQEQERVKQEQER